MIKVKERGRTKAPETSNLASDTRAAAPEPPAEQEANGESDAGLAFIRALPAESRCRSLMLLGLLGPVEERQAILLEALDAATSIPDGSEDADLFDQVARLLPPAEVEAALRKAAAARPSPDDAISARIYANVGKRLQAKSSRTPATKGKAIVENYGETSDNALAMGLLHEYLKTLGVSDSRLPEVAANVHDYALAQAKREVAGHAAPVAAPAPFAEALEAMTLKDRRAALIQHYGLLPDKDGKYALPEEKRWETVKGSNPKPEKFHAWLNKVFPDRREIRMVLSDLKYLDAPAYFKVMNWSDKNSKIEKAVIESFGLPTKKIKYDPVRDANAPKSLNEVFARAERGEDSFRNLSRALSRAQYHARIG
jgi:hypothetical protein